MAELLALNPFQPDMKDEHDVSWFVVGHIDELVSFIPAPGRYGWKMLAADPLLARDIDHNLRKKGQGSVTILTGKFHDENLRQRTLDELVNSELWSQNETFGIFAADTVKGLTAEIGITESDVIRLPVLMYNGGNGYASALTPDIVNGALLNPTYFAAPKPYGPNFKGNDAFEEYMLQKLFYENGVEVRFIEDFYSYHVKHGEVHCGSNVVRKPSTRPWWESVANSPVAGLSGTSNTAKKKSAKKKKPSKKKVKRAKKSKKRKK